MQRKFVIFVNEVHSIGVDEQFESELTNYLESDKKILKKFRFQQQVISKGLSTKEIFEKESPNSNVQNIYCWKVRVTLKGRKVNDRLICKVIETKTGKKIIILAGLFKSKKQDKLSPDQIHLMEKVSAYEYRI